MCVYIYIYVTIHVYICVCIYIYIYIYTCLNLTSNTCYHSCLGPVAAPLALRAQIYIDTIRSDIKESMK